MPSQFYSTPVLPAPMQDARRTLKLGDPRMVNEQDWETHYNEDFNTSVRIPFYMDTIGKITSRAFHQHTTGYVLTSLSVLPARARTIDDDDQ